MQTLRRLVLPLAAELVPHRNVVELLDGASISCAAAIELDELALLVVLQLDGLAGLRDGGELLADKLALLVVAMLGELVCFVTASLVYLFLHCSSYSLYFLYLSNQSSCCPCVPSER